MLADRSTNFFNYLTSRAIFEKNARLGREQEQTPLTEDELLGLEVYGGFHGKAEIYRDFRVVFSAFEPKRFPENIPKTLREINDAAYRASLLFGSLEKYQAFHKRYAGSHFRGSVSYADPLEFFNYISFPKANPETYAAIGFENWLNFLMKAGPQKTALKLFEEFSSRVTPPTQEESSDFVRETIVSAAALSQEIDVGFDDPKIKAITEMAKSEDKKLNLQEYYRAINYHLRVRKRIANEPKKNFPDVQISGDDFGIPGAVFKRLADDDPRILFLGTFTNCCEKVSDQPGSIEHSIIHALTSNDSAFYVVEDENGQIIAHSWSWFSNDSAFVLDGFESHESNFNIRNLEQLIDNLNARFTGDPEKYPNVKGLMIGDCAKHLESLRIERSYEERLTHHWDLVCRVKARPNHFAFVGASYTTLAVVCEL